MATSRAGPYDANGCTTGARLQARSDRKQLSRVLHQAYPTTAARWQKVPLCLASPCGERTLVIGWVVGDCSQTKRQQR
jgi:hypothetical protein